MGYIPSYQSFMGHINVLIAVFISCSGVVNTCGQTDLLLVPVRLEVLISLVSSCFTQLLGRLYSGSYAEYGVAMHDYLCLHRTSVSTNANHWYKMQMCI